MSEPLYADALPATLVLSCLREEEERLRAIARDAHRELGGGLTAVRFGIEELRGAPPAGRAATLDELDGVVTEAAVRVRRMEALLAPPDEFSLPLALPWLHGALAAEGVKAVITSDEAGWEAGFEEGDDGSGARGRDELVHAVRILQDAARRLGAVSGGVPLRLSSRVVPEGVALALEADVAHPPADLLAVLPLYRLRAGEAGADLVLASSGPPVRVSVVLGPRGKR